MIEQVLTYLKFLHFLLTERENGRFVVHCLELDLVVSAPTREEGIRRLGALINTHVFGLVSTGRYQDILTHYAPQEYWDRYMEGQDAGKARLVIRVPRLENTVEAEADDTINAGVLSAMIANQSNAISGTS